MIPLGELTAMRATATSALDIAGVQIRRVTASDDGYGLQTHTWATIATVVASEARPTAAIMAQYAAQIGNLSSWVIRLPQGTDCHAADQILMPSGDIRLVQADLSDSSYSTAQLYLVSEVRQ